MANASRGRKSPPPAPPAPGGTPLAPVPVAVPPQGQPSPPGRRAVSPEMAFAALHLIVALLILAAQYDAAYRSLDRRAPDEDSARSLHIGVIVTGMVLLAAGIWLSQRISPWVGLGALVGVPLGFVLYQMSRTYSHTECWSGFWWWSCSSDDAALPAIHGMLIWFGLAAVLAALVLRLGVGRRASAAALLGAGLAVSSAFVVASINLLLHLHDEALKAAEANRPVIHDTPGLGWAILAAGLLVLAWRARR